MSGDSIHECLTPEAHSDRGGPFRYCSCGWIEARYNQPVEPPLANLCVASLTYVADPQSAKDGKPWCAEFTYHDGDGIEQGWAADPLGAALGLAEKLGFRLLTAEYECDISPGCGFSNSGVGPNPEDKQA